MGTQGASAAEPDQFRSPTPRSCVGRPGGEPSGRDRPGGGAARAHRGGHPPVADALIRPDRVSRLRGLVPQPLALCFPSASDSRPRRLGRDRNHLSPARPAFLHQRVGQAPGDLGGRGDCRLCRLAHRLSGPELRDDPVLQAGEPNLFRPMHRLRSSGIQRPVSLPAVGKLINQPPYAELVEEFGRVQVVEAIREQVAAERGDKVLDDVERSRRVSARLRSIAAPRLQWVINASGVILHTNLGRAPLARSAVDALAVAGGYSNLELDLETGRPGERAELLSGLLNRLFDCQAALVVNNNAAAVLLALTALCKGREVVVSRGQLVEIGGSFRMPDVMRLSGARMVEVGTTNRTRAADYEQAITDRTAALLRVHTSNYRVSGFTESVSLREMEEIARRHNLLLIDDLGSGAVEPIAGEPTVADSVAHCDVVTFSGDKLFGGPQAGIVLGRGGAVNKMARHPLARAVRIDKLTLAALEATI